MPEHPKGAPAAGAVPCRPDRPPSAPASPLRRPGRCSPAAGRAPARGVRQALVSRRALVCVARRLGAIVRVQRPLAAGLRAARSVGGRVRPSRARCQAPRRAARSCIATQGTAPANGQAPQPSAARAPACA